MIFIKQVYRLLDYLLFFLVFTIVGGAVTVAVVGFVVIFVVVAGAFRARTSYINTQNYAIFRSSNTNFRTQIFPTKFR